MARVRVTRTVEVAPLPNVSRVYEAGWEGPAPDAVIDIIVAAGAGERLSHRGNTVATLDPAPPPQAGEGIAREAGEGEGNPAPPPAEDGGPLVPRRGSP